MDLLVTGALRNRERNPVSPHQPRTGERRRARAGLKGYGCSGSCPHAGAAVQVATTVVSVARGLLIAFFGIAAIVGLLFITRGTAVKRVTGVGADETAISPADPTFPVAVAVLTGSQIVGGNEVTLVLNGDETFPRLWDDLRAATRSITVQMYYAEPGRVADTLRSILAERARAGVRVYLLYDAFGSNFSNGYLDELGAAGVRAVAFRPLRFKNLWVVQNRSHIRGVVIDGRIGWTGGFGIDDKWLGAGRRPDEWRDTNVRFQGPAVRQLQAAFAAGWAEATGQLITARMTVDTFAGGVAKTGLLYTAPTLGSTPAERYLALSIASAQQRLYITNAYFAPDANFMALLTRAAKRGVDVCLLVGGPLTDVRMARLAAHARYEKLLKAGVRIYEYQPTTLHSKTFVVDGIWVSVGTMNFDNRSLALNDEATLMTLDSSAGKRMEDVFNEDLRYALQIHLESFSKRSHVERVKEWGANLITRVL
jgi:cardiolipin synthase A/B